MRVRRTLTALLFLFSLSVSQAQLKDLRPEEYGQWESISFSRLSDDGRWFAFNVSTVAGDSRFTVRNTDGPVLAAVPIGSTADLPGGAVQFTDDSKFVGYMIAPPKAVSDKLKEEKKPVEIRLAIRSLAANQEQIFEGVRTYKFLKGGRFLVFHRQRTTEPGADMVVVDLSDGTQSVFSNVVDFELNDAENLIAFEMETPGGFQGIQTFEPSTGTLRSVDWGKSDLGNLTFAEKADTLAYLRGRRDETKEGSFFSVVRATDLRKPKPTLQVFDPEKVESFPKGKRIAEFGGVRLNKDGTIVGFGIQTWSDKKKPDARPQDKSTVEIWSTRDIRVVPEQRVSAARDRARTQPVIWRTANGPSYQIVVPEADLVPFVSTMNFNGEPVRVTANLERAILFDAKPYARPDNDGITPYDLYRIDTLNGHRERIAEKVLNGAQLSPDGGYVTFFQLGNWWVVNLETGEKRNITAKQKFTFADELNDETTPEKPPVAGPTWFRDDSGAIYYDRYDAWLYRPSTGTLQPLTDGRKDRLVMRFEDVEDDPEGLRADAPLYFHAFNDVTKASGYYLADGKGSGKILAMDAASITGLSKIKTGDRYAFVMGNFEKSPNVYVTNGQFSAIKPITNTNPQQAQYKWGKAQSIGFKSKWGAELQGTLIYPAGYEKGKTYPMVTYIYERLSDELHRYILPVEWSSYNPQVLSQNGYFVWMPDIAYKPRNPGISAVECLEPSVQAVLKLNVGVDATKIGLIGHSWGGYQTAFATTVSKVFAVGVAGAPLTDLPSMHGSFYLNQGVPNGALLETSQGRMEVPFYDDLETYLRNSPVFRSKERNTPLLIAQGTADGAVPYQQGYMLYNTLRRMGKNAVFLSYGGE
ncbi:MAG: S9 family peptidase, partial [Fimbriimonas sp.]